MRKYIRLSYRDIHHNRIIIEGKFYVFFYCLVQEQRPSPGLIFTPNLNHRIAEVAEQKKIILYLQLQIREKTSSSYTDNQHIYTLCRHHSISLIVAHYNHHGGTSRK